MAKPDDNDDPIELPDEADEETRQTYSARSYGTRW